MFAIQDHESFYDQLVRASILPYPEGLSELLTADFFDDSQKLNWILEKALLNKDKRIIEFLLSSGIGVNRLNDANQTALHLVARHGFFDVVERLFDRCKVNHRDIHGFSHFHVACMAGNVEMVKYFLARSVDVNTAETKDFFTPLHFAVEYRRAEVVELLLKNNAEPNALDHRYRNPLHLICQDRSSMVPKRKFTDRVCAEAELRIMKLLVEFGSDVNSVDHLGNTPLMYVFKNLHPDRMYSQEYCSKSENCKFFDEYRKLQRHKVDLLLLSEANVRLMNNDGETALHIVISNTRRSRSYSELWYLDDVVNVEVSELLLKRGALINARNKRNETPLQIAVSAMSLATVKLLLNYNAEIKDLRFEKGCFHYSADGLPCLEATENLVEMIQVLLDKGFAMSLRDNLAVLKFFVPDQKRLCEGKVEGTTYMLKNLLEYGTSEMIQNVLNNFPPNLNDTSLPEQYSRKRAIQQIQLYLTTLKIGNLYLDDDMRLYLEEKISILRKYLLALLLVSESSSQTDLIRLQDEVQLMKTTMITKDMSLHDALRENPHGIRRLRELSSILKSEVISNRFPRCIGIIKGHCAKSLIRRYVCRSTEQCLPSLTYARLPQLCCKRICKYLSNETMINVCTAAVDVYADDDSMVKRLRES